MKDLLDYCASAFMVMILAILVVGIPILSYYSAIHRAEVWNRCHPDTQITVKEAWFARKSIIIGICETEGNDG